MNNVWWTVLAVIVGGSILKHVLMNPLAAVVVDLVVFALVYVVLRRYPYIDFRRTIIFFGGLTAVNVLVDLGIIDGMIGNIALLILLGWMMFSQGGGSGRPPKPRHKWHK